MIWILVCLLIVSGVHGQEKAKKIVAEKGSSVVLECSEADSEKCELIKNHKTMVSRNVKSDKYKILENGNCKINITNLELGDAGIYACHTTDSPSAGFQFEVIVTVTPSKPLLMMYNDNLILNGSMKLIDGNTDMVTLYCLSVGGYPESKIHWTLNDKPIKDATENSYQSDSLLPDSDKLYITNSTVVIELDQNSPDKIRRDYTVSCIVDHVAYSYEAVAWGILARKYATSDVMIELNGEVLKTEIKCGEGIKVYELKCVSNGLPEANEWQWRVDDKEWENGDTSKWVGQPGQFTCRARNMASAKYVPSQTVKFVGSSGDHAVPATLNFIFLLLVILVLSWYH